VLLVLKVKVLRDLKVKRVSQDQPVLKVVQVLLEVKDPPVPLELLELMVL